MKHTFLPEISSWSRTTAESTWVGIFERVIKKVYLEVMLQRNAETLYNNVSIRVLTETRIYSYTWRRITIRQHYELLYANPRIYFVDPENRELHTNNVVRL